jgi:hypothetical protein
MVVVTTTPTAAAPEPPAHQHEDGLGRGNSAAEWEKLTARSTALCRQDPQRWQACADRSDDLEAHGVPALDAVRIALAEYHG